MHTLNSKPYTQNLMEVADLVQQELDALAAYGPADSVKGGLGFRDLGV